MQIMHAIMPDHLWEFNISLAIVSGCQCHNSPENSTITEPAQCSPRTPDSCTSVHYKASRLQQQGSTQHITSMTAIKTRGDNYDYPSERDGIQAPPELLSAKMSKYEQADTSILSSTG